MRLLAVEHARRTFAVEARPRLDHERTLAFHQPLRTLRRVAERDAGTQDVIEPGLERRRDTEIVHRRTDHDDVGGVDLADQSIGKCKRVALGVRRCRAADGANRLGRQMRQRLGANVANVDLGRGISILQAIGEHPGELERDGRFAGGGTVDDEGPGHVVLRYLLSSRR